MENMLTESVDKGKGVMLRSNSLDKDVVDEWGGKHETKSTICLNGKVG